MFERYTERARRMLFFARYEASQLGSTAIDTEHLLLGLIRERGGLAAAILARLDCSVETLRKEIEQRAVFREKVATSVEIPFSRDTQKVLNLAAEEADGLLHNYIAPEHLLLGLLREEKSVAGSVLAAHGVRLSDAREIAGQPVAHIEFRKTSHGDVSSQVDQIKALVRQLARLSSGGNEAHALTTRIFDALEALKAPRDRRD